MKSDDMQLLDPTLQIWDANAKPSSYNSEPPILQMNLALNLKFRNNPCSYIFETYY